MSVESTSTTGSTRLAPVQRLYERLKLSALERLFVRHRTDWDGYYRVLRKFKPVGKPVVYLNQIWSEWEAFVRFVAPRKPRRILEIGTGRGGSTYFWSKLGSKDSQFITIDIEPVCREYVRLYRRRNRGQITSIIASSHDPATVQRVSKILKSRPLDILYIDGDHTYEGVKKDFELYKGFCDSNSLICLHDIVPDHGVTKGIETDADSGEVYKLWAELKAQYEYKEFVSEPGQNGFGIGVIFYRPSQESKDSETHV